MFEPYECITCFFKLKNRLLINVGNYTGYRNKGGELEPVIIFSALDPQESWLPFLKKSAPRLEEAHLSSLARERIRLSGSTTVSAISRPLCPEWGLPRERGSCSLYGWKWTIGIRSL